MGSDGRFPYPKEVWSPGGGWWPNPKAWRRNTAAAFGILVITVIPVFILSEKKTVSYGESLIFLGSITLYITERIIILTARFLQL